MKVYKIFLYLYFIFLSSLCCAQTNEIDSLKALISNGRDDTSKVNNLLQLTKAYTTSFPESAMRSGN